MVLTIKLRASGKRLTPFISSVSTNGKVQKAFKTQIGDVVGACVKSNVKKGMTAGAIKKAVRDCGKKSADTKLKL